MPPQKGGIFFYGQMIAQSLRIHDFNSKLNLTHNSRINYNLNKTIKNKIYVHICVVLLNI